LVATPLHGSLGCYLIEIPVLKLRERLFPRRVSVITEEEMGDGRPSAGEPAVRPETFGDDHQMVLERSVRDEQLIS
jgi:hypothetical protein